MISDERKLFLQAQYFNIKRYVRGSEDPERDALKMLLLEVFFFQQKGNCLLGGMIKYLLDIYGSKTELAAVLQKQGWPGRCNLNSLKIALSKYEWCERMPGIKRFVLIEELFKEHLINDPQSSDVIEAVWGPRNGDSKFRKNIQGESNE